MDTAPSARHGTGREPATASTPVPATGLITLTTDFGTRDGYVGAMKGVLCSERPGARIVDITHDVPPQDVMAGAFALAQAARFFPPGTVHVAVVDPGVGSGRRALIVEHGGSLFVGPDNGLLWLAAPVAPVGGGVAHAIDRVPAEWPVHPTFHGRDLFARVAGRLAGGAPVAEFSSSRAEDALQLGWPSPASNGSELQGQVIHVDRFGNLVTNVSELALARLLVGDGVADAAGGHAGPALPELAGRFTVEVDTGRAQLVHTYADVERGRLLAYVGSTRYLEIAVRDGSAADLLSAGRGTAVRVALNP